MLHFRADDRRPRDDAKLFSVKERLRADQSKCSERSTRIRRHICSFNGLAKRLVWLRVQSFVAAQDLDSFIYTSLRSQVQMFSKHVCPVTMYYLKTGKQMQSQAWMKTCLDINSGLMFNLNLVSGWMGSCSHNTLVFSTWSDSKYWRIWQLSHMDYLSTNTQIWVTNSYFWLVQGGWRSHSYAYS